MIGRGADSFAETDRHHLEHSALDGARKLRMRFHPVYDDDCLT
jgi:hypothetical protein